MYGSEPILEVARPNYSLDDINLAEKNKAFSSKWNTPKIFKSITIERPSGISNDTEYTEEYAHNLGYVPRFWHMVEKYGMWGHDGEGEPNYGDSTFSAVTMDASKYYFTLRSYVEKLQVFLMFDRLAGVGENSIILPNNPFIRVAKENYNADIDHPVNMDFDSLWMMPKVVYGGRLSITAPAISGTYGEYYETSYEHNLGYAPFFTPEIPKYVVLQRVYDGFGNIPSTVYLNDLTDITLVGDEDIEESEMIYIQVDDTKLEIRWYRDSCWYLGSFPERTLVLDFNLFELPLGEAFDLLN
jgi:hypothetical protein